ncbi:MAG: hypothetical protein AABY83_03050 [Pseudomonadota bacterium]
MSISNKTLCIAYLILVGITVALPMRALADAYHYTNILVGDRAAGLAGAYTAISDDPTGLYYNPAGIVYAVGSNLSGSMNALHVSQTNYKNALGNQTWMRTSIALLPNFFGMIQPFGGGTLGFSYAIPDSTLENQQQKFNLPNSLLGNNTDLTINFNNQDVVYNIGPSFAVKFTEKFSLGLTLYGVVHQQRLIFNQEFKAASGYHWVNSYANFEEYGLRPIVGMMWSPIEKLSFGAAFSQPKMVYTRNTVQLSCARNNTATYPDNSVCKNGLLLLNNSIDNQRYIKPWSVELGAAYFYSTALLLTTTLSAYENLYRSTAQISPELPLVNVAGGFEYYFLGNYAMRAGLYTNLANSPEIFLGKTGQGEHVNLYGMTFSLSNFTRSSAITGGLGISTGQGKAQVVEDTTDIQDVSVYIFSLFLSASYSY